MLFSRYAGGAIKILKYDYEYGIQIINKAIKKKADENMYHRWLCGYEKEMSFAEFKRELKKAAPSSPVQQTREKTEKETLDIVRKILEMR